MTHMTHDDRHHYRAVNAGALCIEGQYYYMNPICALPLNNISHSASLRHLDTEISKLSGDGMGMTDCDGFYLTARGDR